MSLSEIQTSFLKALKDNMNKEVQRGQTLVGPHRDDVIFLLSGRDLRLFGSQGQMRTMVLSLKIAELDYLSQKLQEVPLLLLDDVLAELDPQRQSHLLQLMNWPKVQTFLTTTHLDETLKQFLKERSVIFRVEQGKVEPVADSN